MLSKEGKLWGFLSVCERHGLFQQLIPPSEYTAHIK